jgi:hypothetical protein
LAHIKGKDLNEEDMDIPLIKVTFPHPTYVIQLEEEVKRLNQMFVDSSIHNLIDNENEGYDEELMPKKPLSLGFCKAQEDIMSIKIDCV